MYEVLDDTCGENILVLGVSFRMIGLGDFWKGVFEIMCVVEFEVLYCVIGGLRG